MTYFKLNIPKIEESIENYKKNKIEYLENLDYIYKSFGYLDFAWNDSNSLAFKENIKKNRYQFYDYFEYLDNIYDEINKFQLNITNIYNHYGYISKNYIIKFDDSEIFECKKKLNCIIEILDDCLNKINLNDFKYNIEYSDIFYELRSEIKIIKKYINDLNSNIESLSNSINKELINSNFRINKIEKVLLKVDAQNYKWKIQNLNIS